MEFIYRAEAPHKEEDAAGSPLVLLETGVPTQLSVHPLKNGLFSGYPGVPPLCRVGIALP